MQIPVWVLLWFVTWTLLILFTTFGVHCWTRILIDRAIIAEWQAAVAHHQLAGKASNLPESLPPGTKRINHEHS